MKKRVLSLMLCVLMLVSLLPMSAFAEGNVCEMSTNGGEAVGYETIADAVAADKTASALEGYQGSTITMLKDTALSGGITIAAGQKVTLELAGKVVSCNTDAATSFAIITNNGNLTIQDSTDTAKNGSGTGKITTTAYDPDMQAVPGYATNTITNQGTLTVKSGWIESGSLGRASFAIDNLGAMKSLTITGGKVTAGSSMAIRYWTSNCSGDTSVKISDAEIGSFWLQDSEKNNSHTHSLTMQDTHFAKHICIGYYGYALNLTLVIENCVFDEWVEIETDFATAANNNKITFTGNKVLDYFTMDDHPMNILTDGYYGNDVSEYCAASYYCIPNKDSGLTQYHFKIGTAAATKKTASVKLITEEAETYYYTLQEACRNASDGDTIQLLTNTTLYEDITVEKDITIDLNNKMLTADTDHALYVYGCDVTVKNGTITNTGEVFYIDGYNYLGNVTLSNVNITSTGDHAVVMEYGNLISEDGSSNSINASDSDSAAIYCSYYGYVTGDGELQLDGGKADLWSYGTITYKWASGWTSCVFVSNPASLYVDAANLDATSDPSVEASGWSNEEKVAYATAYAKKYKDYNVITTGADELSSAGNVYLLAGTYAEDVYDYTYDTCTTIPNYASDAPTVIESYTVVDAYAQVSYAWKATPTETAYSHKETIASAMANAKTYADDNVDEKTNVTVMILRSNAENITVPAGVTVIVPSAIGSDAIAYNGTIKAADGYVLKTESKQMTVFGVDDVVCTVYTVRTEDQQVEVKNATNDQQQVITVNMAEAGQDEDYQPVPDVKINTVEAANAIDSEKKDAVTVVEDIKANTAVSGFSDVNIDEALTVTSAAKDQKQKVVVVPEAIVTTTETTYTGAENATLTTSSMTFDVTPKYSTDGGSTWTTIKNEDIEGEITFRLPVQSNISKDTAAVYHSTTEGTKGDFIGFYEITTDTNGKKYIELSASSFSFYTYEVMTGISQTNTVAVKHSDGTYTGYDTLADGVANFVATGDTPDTAVILLTDFANPDFASKTATVDLNGHKLTGNATNATDITIKNSDTTNKTTLAAVGIYYNDVAEFAADGYDAKEAEEDSGIKNQLYDVNAEGVYRVVVKAVGYDSDGHEVDRVSGTNTDTTAQLDLFAGDTVKVTVKVYGAKFVAAKVRLTYDSDNFELVDMTQGWTMSGDTLTFYKAKSTSTTDPTYWEDGYTLGEFEFEVLPGETAKLDEIFQISDYDTYVAGSWSNGWSGSAANKLSTDNLEDDYTNIRLMNMDASVTPNTKLVYNATAQNLLAAGFTCKDSTTMADISGATITYAVMTQAEVDAGDGGNTPDEDDYKTTQEGQTNAGTYVIFWKVTKSGYIPVTGQNTVTIEKKAVDLTWTMAASEGFTDPGDSSYDGNNDLVTADSWNKYSELAAKELDQFTLPTAQYTTAKNGTEGATFTATEAPVGAVVSGTCTLKNVGTYTFTADENPNYSYNNPTFTVLIDGGVFKDYGLDQTNTGTETWMDGTAHIIAEADTTGNGPADTKIQYSIDGGATWFDDIPTAKLPGTYTLTMRLTADSYYTKEYEVNYTIKSVDYVTEQFEYVAGWSIVLVYTNDEVPGFTYNGTMMWDVTALGYKYGTEWNAAGTAVIGGSEGTEYEHVYAIVVNGTADTTKVTPSNSDAKTLTMDNTNNLAENMRRYDVNNSGSADIYDMVAITAVYNVNSLYFGSITDDLMEVILKSDVSGNKVVNTYDYSKISSVTL